MREDAQSGTGGVAGEVDQEVDFVLTDQFSQGGIIQSGYIAELGAGAEGIGDPVVDLTGAVGEGGDA